MIISSRTPEGEPNRCSVCNSDVRIDPTLPTGDAPCPNCGQLLWFPSKSITVAEKIGANDIDALLYLVSQRGTKKLLLDFRGVSFMSSSMISKLATLNKAVKSVSGRLIFCNVSPNVLEVFKLTKLDKLFDLR